MNSVKHIFLIYGAACIVFISCPCLLSAQTLINGTVTDQENNPVAGANISLLRAGLYSFTDSTGYFEIDGLNEGTYQIRITSIGFHTYETDVTLSRGVSAELDIVLEPRIYESETMVVTATRTRRDIEAVPIPMTVVNREQIQRSGSMRLSDILQEQTGLTVSSDHGTGIQVQGFNPDYTLIMLDGQPIIGRTAGTLDLTRISVQNVEQIEIVKGPSSALWGSDALAGVINVITATSDQPFEWGVNTRYGTHNNIDVGTDMSIRSESFQNRFFANHNRSDGYRLNPGSVSRTVPVFESYTASYQGDLDLSNTVNASLGARYFLENQENFSLNPETTEEQILRSDDRRTDFSLHPAFELVPADRLTINFDHYYNLYQTESNLEVDETNETFDRSDFNQYYNKSETSTSYLWNDTHQTLAGGGYVHEKLVAERYPSEPVFISHFLFLQHEWFLLENLEVIGGFRYDGHSEYQSQVSPKFSARYKLNELFQLRASAGRGFKAPDFRQLFLDFTNATAGYSVFGSSTVRVGLERLENENQISQVLIPASTIEGIKAESSLAVNAGIDVTPTDDLVWRVNVFRNNVRDLIETAPVAQKTNGQSVFSYFNLEQVYTQGIETEVRWQTPFGLAVSAGYQFLDARRKIDEERMVQDDDGEIVQKQFTSHEPMFNRSKHSGTLKLFYEHENGWDINLRGVLKGKYGITDSNGNGYVDSDEYTDGYTLWNLAAAKEFGDHYRLQIGLDNLLNYTHTNLPWLSGRLWYGQVSIRF